MVIIKLLLGWWRETFRSEVVHMDGKRFGEEEEGLQNKMSAPMFVA
jgi:hypothetical protein